MAKADLFNLTIYDDPGKGTMEKFLNVAVTATAGARRLDRVLTSESNLARVQLKADGTPDLVTPQPANSAANEDPAERTAH